MSAQSLAAALDRLDVLRMQEATCRDADYNRIADARVSLEAQLMAMQVGDVTVRQLVERLA